MANYEEQLQAEDYEAAVAAIRSALDSMPDDGRAALEQIEPGLVRRLQTLLDHVLVLTSTTTPELVPVDRPAQLSAQLRSIRLGLQSLANEPMNAQLYSSQVASYVTALVNWLWTWQGSMSSGDWRDAVTGAATVYRRSVGQQISSATAELTDLKGKIGDSRADLEEIRANMRELTTTTEAQLSGYALRAEQQIADLTVRVDAVTQQITGAIERQDTAIRQYQEQFSIAQERRSNEFASLTQISEDSFQQMLHDYIVRSDTQVDALKNEVAKAAGMVSVFAGAGTANAYGIEAQSQAEAANKWRKSAILLSIAGAIAGAVMLFAFSDQNASVGEIAGKLAVTVVVAGAASYAAAQSSAHRKREVTNRRAELLLVSFEPFVRELPTEERDKARVALLQTLLTDSAQLTTSDTTSAEDAMVSMSQLNLLKQLADVFGKR